MYSNILAYNGIMINKIQIEICLGNIQDVATLNKYPIDRIELNCALELGGMTPSLNTLVEAKKISNKQIIAMCRCRGGDFCYSDEEYDVMFKDARLMLENGADGIVFGFLNSDKTINTTKTKEMIELIHAYGKQAVFHKAFDELKDQDEGCRILSELKCDRILTGGKAKYPDIIEGAKTINELHQKYRNIQLLPGGGVRIENIQEVVNTANSGQVHMTAKKTYAGGYIGLDEPQLIKMLEKLEELS